VSSKPLFIVFLSLTRFERRNWVNLRLAGNALNRLIPEALERTLRLLINL